MRKTIVAAALGVALAYGSAGSARAQDQFISADGPSGIVTVPIERFDANQAQHIYFTNPEFGSGTTGLSTGGPIDNSVGTGHATFSSGDFQGDIGEGLSNEAWRVNLDDEIANGGNQPNDSGDDNGDDGNGGVTGGS